MCHVPSRYEVGGTCLESGFVEGDVRVCDGALRWTGGGVGRREVISGLGSDMLLAWMKLEWRRPVSTIVRV